MKANYVNEIPADALAQVGQKSINYPVVLNDDNGTYLVRVNPAGGIEVNPEAPFSKVMEAKEELVAHLAKAVATGKTGTRKETVSRITNVIVKLESMSESLRAQASDLRGIS